MYIYSLQCEEGEDVNPDVATPARKEHNVPKDSTGPDILQSLCTLYLFFADVATSESASYTFFIIMYVKRCY